MAGIMSFFPFSIGLFLIIVPLSQVPNIGVGVLTSMAAGALLIILARYIINRNFVMVIIDSSKKN